jgi:hypothetical protein
MFIINNKLYAEQRGFKIKSKCLYLNHGHFEILMILMKNAYFLKNVLIFRMVMVMVKLGPLASF